MPSPSPERIPVLMYHCVGEPLSDTDRNYCISPADFARHMAALARRGHVAVPLARLVRWLDGGEDMPVGAFVLTFDDGYRGVREDALPVLKKRNWPFTVFLVSAFIGGKDEWNARRSAERSQLLAREEILGMARLGVDFQSHTRTHRRLPGLAYDDLRRELVDCKAELETLLGKPVPYLAYPYGECDERVIAAARAAGYAAAFSTQPGFNRRDVDRFRIRRLDVRGTDSAAQLVRKLELGANDGSLQQLFGYFGRRMARRLWSRAESKRASS